MMTEDPGSKASREQERRQHRRLAIRLPLECWIEEGSQPALLGAVTRNISTGGLYVEGELANGSEPPATSALMTVQLTVPPGEGHFPYEGQVRSVAEVLRCALLEATAHESARRRVGIAARFREPLKLAF